jgi:aminodeoxyfutalosine deaminase
MATVYFAKWIYLPSGEILVNGGLSIEGDRILSVGQRSHVKRSGNDRIVNLGDMALFPGFINIHTHLEEDALRDQPKSPEETFASWITKRQTRLRQLPEKTIENAVRLCSRELLTNGITTVVDCSRRGISRAVLSAEPVRSIVIREVHPETAEEEAGVPDLLKPPETGADSLQNGIGPYSLFSVSPSTHALIADHSRRTGRLWAAHCAESSEELQAFSDQTGDLYFQISRKKGWRYGKVSRGSMDWALSRNIIPDNALCIHCNYTSPGELEALASKGASVALCFQYSSELGHKAFPLDSAMKRGVNICAGTESLSSDRSMNLLDELFWAHRRHPHIAASEMIRWITQNPARAVGAQDRLGSLSEGKFADIIGLRFHQDPNDALLEELIDGDPEVRLVIVNGEEIISE